MTYSKVLLIDDDEQLTSFIAANVEDHPRFRFTVKNSVEAAINLLLAEPFDVVVIDVMMPGVNGIDGAVAIRNKYPDMGIIFISSRHEIEIKRQAFSGGADDYLHKPFNLTELMMRLEALVRRLQLSRNGGRDTVYSSSFTLGKYHFDSEYRKLTINEKELTLSNKENSILKILCEANGSIVKRDYILLNVWGKCDEFAKNSMDVYMARLRKLLKEDLRVKINNTHGLGFSLVKPADLGK